MPAEPEPKKVVRFDEWNKSDLFPGLKVVGFKNESDLDRFIEVISPSREDLGPLSVPLSQRLEMQKRKYATLKDPEQRRDWEWYHGGVHFLGKTSGLNVTILDLRWAIRPNHIATFRVQRDLESTGRGVVATERTLCGLYVGVNKLRIGREVFINFCLALNMTLENAKEMQSRIEELMDQSCKNATRGDAEEVGLRLPPLPHSVMSRFKRRFGIRGLRDL